MRTITFVLLLAIGLLGSKTMLAQESKSSPKSEMNVDLPDETEETDLVEKGQIQLETQCLFNFFSDGETALIGQALIRYGVLKKVELRLLVEDGFNRDRYIEDAVQSTYPLAGSIKVSLLKDHKFLPDMTFVSYLRLPFTSSSKEQTAYWSPIALLAFQNKIGDKIKLEYNVGLQQEAYGKDLGSMVNASLHYKLLEKLEVFSEYYAQFSEGERPHHNAGLGFAYQIGDHMELYAVGAGSIFYDDPNQFLSCGIAFRMP